jgi:hypothetical protein
MEGIQNPASWWGISRENEYQLGLDIPEGRDLGHEFRLSYVKRGDEYLPQCDFVTCPWGNIDNIYTLEEK